MVVSEPLPTVILIGGDGGPSGVPRHILHLTDAFNDAAKVIVISDENHGGYDTVATRGGTHRTIRGLQSRLSLPHLWRGWRGLIGYLRSHPADVVWLHARLPVLLGRMALVLRLFRPKGRVAVTYHGLPFGPGHRPLASKVSVLLERLLLSTCPQLDLIFLSDDMAARMQEKMGRRRMGRHRSHVLPNCSDLGDLPAKKPSDARNLIMTGRAGWQKNYPLAAQVFAHLPDTYSLTLSGLGTDDPAFQHNINAQVPSKTARRIEFAGPLSDVRPALMAANAYLLCSRYEGLPIGALEAMEAGLPMALGQFDGAETLARDNPYAVLLDFNDLEKDAAALDALITKYNRNSQKARQEIQYVWQSHWSPGVFAARSRDLLKKLVRE